MSLEPVVDTAESLVLAYETVIATRLAAGACEVPVNARMVCAVLGLDAGSPDDPAHCQGVVEAAERTAVAAIRRG